MNLKEYAEENGMTLKEAKELTGLTHWKQEVVVDTPEEPESVADNPVTEVVIETESKEEEHDLKLIELSIRGAGVKSPYWELRHLVK